MPLMTAYDVIVKRVDYSRTDSGWRAEFRGPITVQVEAGDLESCRRALFNAVDARVAEWLSRQPRTSDRKGAGRSSPRAGS